MKRLIALSLVALFLAHCATLCTGIRLAEREASVVVERLMAKFANTGNRSDLERLLAAKALSVAARLAVQRCEARGYVVALVSVPYNGATVRLLTVEPITYEVWDGTSHVVYDFESELLRLKEN